MKTATIKDYLFERKIIITFGSFKEVKEWLLRKENAEGEINDRWGAFSGRLPSGDHHIHFDYYGFSAVVHETNHATLDILNDAGIRVNQETKEVFAYYQDWLAGKCRDYLEKWTDKNKTRKMR
jgi:hypothetical protein